MCKFLKKKPDELTTGETLGYVGLVMVVCYTPIVVGSYVIEHSDEIKEATSKAVGFAKKKLGLNKSDEEKEEWIETEVGWTKKEA